MKTTTVRLPNLYRMAKGAISELFVEKMAGFMETDIKSRPGSRFADEAKSAEFGTFIDAFTKHPWLYAGAMALAIAAPKPKLRIMAHGRRDEPIEVIGEDINRLIRRPNPFLSYRELIQITVVNKVITGNHYITNVGTKEGFEISKANPPVELWWMKPEAVHIKDDPDLFIEKYVYTSAMGKKTDLHPSEVIHFKLINPDSYFVGLGTVEPAKNSVIQEFNAIAYNKNFMQNDGIPAGYFHSPGRLKKEQIERMIRQWKKDHGSPKKAGGLGFLYGGIEFKETGAKPRDMQYAEMRKLNREEILATIGVPPSIVGLLEYANYSNMEIQKLKFWEDTVIPILGMIEDKLTLNLAAHFNDEYYFEFDYSGIEALNVGLNEKADMAQKLVNSGIMSPDRAGLRFFNEPMAGGAAAFRYMPIGMVPLDGTAPANGKGVKGLLTSARSEDEDEGDGNEPSFWEKGTRKEILWRAFEKRVKARETRYQEKAEEFLKDQADRVKEKMARKSSVTEIQQKIDQIFNEEREIKKYKTRFTPYCVDAFKEGGNTGLDATEGKIYTPETKAVFKESDAFELRPEYLAEIEVMIFESGTKISRATLEVILTEIKKAAEENLTVEQLTAAVFDTLQDYAGHRSRRIARTELAKFENFGILEGYKQSGSVEFKGWLSAFTKDTREGHKAADRATAADPVPLNDPFQVGITGAGDLEELMYPGDHTGSAGNVINCLCSTYPVIKDF